MRPRYTRPEDHLLGEVADGQHPLPISSEDYLLVRSLYVGGPRLWGPADHRRSQIGVVSGRNVQQDVQVLTAAIFVALTRPFGYEWKAMLPSDRGRDLAVCGRVLVLKRSDRDHDFQRAANSGCVLPAVSEFLDTVVSRPLV
jgi:hypothetical protein